jgi:hypothetical protein
MEYTEEQKSQFKAAYALRRKRQLAVSAPLVVLVLALVFTKDHVGGTLLATFSSVAVPLFLIVVVGALIFSFRNWRCPACGKYLGRSFNPKHCQSCGVALRD